jgi:hypothetical protein
MRALVLLFVILSLQGCSALGAPRPLERALECECCTPLGLAPARLGPTGTNLNPKPFELQGVSVHGD